MSTDAGSVRVNIFNQTYSLRSASGDGEQVRRLAQLVDERMRAVASGLAVHDVAKVAVLTALNLADELEGLRSFYETELREMLSRAREQESEAAAPAPESPREVLEEPRPSLDAQPPFQDSARDAAEGAAPREEQSWFEAIFDTDAPPPRAGDERLSSRISSRLRRLRQSSLGNSITEGGGEEPEA